MPLLVRPCVEADGPAVCDVLFAAALERAVRAGRPAPFDAPAAARAALERLRAADPEGGVVAMAGGDVVGAGWTHARGRVATIGPVLLLPRWRGLGGGRQLLAACVAAAGMRGVQVRLVEDAADPAAVGLALRGGFRVVTTVLELERSRALVPEPDLPAVAGATLRWAVGADEAELVARDARAWGASRPADLRALAARGIAAVLERHDRVLAHGYARRDADAVRVGPVLGDEGTVATALVEVLAAELARAEVLPVRVLVPAGDRRFVDGLLGRGFRVRATLAYLVAGGGTAPPPGYALASRLLA
jgi:GNAT superfamily N-acetyltransferase